MGEREPEHREGITPAFSIQLYSGVNITHENIQFMIAEGRGLNVSNKD